MSLKKEQINKDFESLYLEIPRVVKPTGQELETALQNLKQDSEDNLFNIHARTIVDAVLQTRDFEASNEFHRKCVESAKKEENLGHLCTLLSAVSLTNSVIKIDSTCRPANLFKKMKIDNKQQILALLKYTNNYLNEIIGMICFRDESKQFLSMLYEIYEQYKNNKDDADVITNVFRCYYSIARCATPNQLTQELLDQFEKLFQENLSRQNGTQFDQITFNLICGIIGRTSLTLINDQPSRGNKYKQHLNQTIKPDVLTSEMVCVADLKKFLAFNKFKKESEEDQMF